MENNNQPGVDSRPPDPQANQSTSPAPVTGQVYVSGEQPYAAQATLSPAGHSNKLLWSGAVFLGTLLVATVVFFIWADKPHTHKAPMHSTSTTPSTKVAAPLVTTQAPAALGQGTYTVGSSKNILPGLYSLSPGPQQNGTFTITGPTANYSVALNDAATGAGSDTKVAWAMLSDGDTVQISGGNSISVHFRPVTLPSSLSPTLAKLYDSNIIVTDTPNRVNPGKYVITDTSDQNAYILIVDKNYTVKYNQALNSTGFHAVLEDGDQIGTIHMSAFKMNPE